MPRHTRLQSISLDNLKALAQSQCTYIGLEGVSMTLEQLGWLLEVGLKINLPLQIEN